MKKTILILCGFTLTVVTSFSQGTITGDWEENPKPHAVASEFAGESAVIIEDHTSIKYTDEEDKQLWMHRTTHRTIKIQDEKGIEEFNKMSVPVYEGEVMEVLKARTILANGTVIEVSRDKMKESKGDDNNVEISFAMDGLEKNAEVEMLISYKKPAVMFGKELFQFSIPVVHAVFDLSSPSRLRFEEKGYNGFPSSGDTLIGATRYVHAEQFKIPALRSEDYSFLEINRMQAAYKVSYMPEEKDMVRKFTWQQLAERLYSNTYTFSDRESKAVENYLNAIGVSSSDKEEQKIKKIESAIKNNITLYKKIDDEDAGKLENVIATKSATETSIIRLFAACFLKAGVKHELGATTNRTQNTFDTEFENWNTLDNYLFYFPAQKKFLSPTYMYGRYPFTTTDALGNKGVFCKLTTLGEVTTAIADIRTISPEPASLSQNNIIASISFTKDLEATAEVSYSFSGYCAIGMRELVVLLPKDKLKELTQNIVAIADKPEHILNDTITGQGFDNYYDDKPLLFTASVKTPQLVEKAGAKYLLRIGDVIGKQSELYQTAERKLPVDFEYPHYLNRTITVHIPEGYKILNPDAIKIVADYKDEAGTPVIGFTSDYTIEGNTLTVNITEFYAQIHFPLSGYEPFRKVVNASADFNKVTLLLGKI